MNILRSILATALLAAAALAADLINKDHDSGLAIEGYDPVAFFTQGAPVKGDPARQARYQEAVYQFATAENQAAFERDPAKYAPQFGGYCAYGVAKGKLVSVDIDTWVIVDGKLYLNYNQRVARLFAKDTAALITEAEKQWPALVTEQAK